MSEQGRRLGQSPVAKTDDHASQVPLDLAQSTLRATLSRAIAQTLVDGFDNAEQEGHPLTLLQQTDIVTMGVMAYETAVRDGEVGLSTWASLRSLPASDPPAAAPQEREQT